MYLYYDEYVELGGHEFTDDAFSDAEVRAELILDDLTLNRLRELDWRSFDWARRVKRAMTVAVDSLPALDSAFSSDVAGGAGLSSFSNGVDSFSFSSSNEAGEYETVRGSLAGRLVAILPVELCSACVGWNHAR